MGFVKCPRCELNYIKEGEKLCSVCRREVRGEPEHNVPDLCSECGERPAIPGSELCLLCLKELNRRSSPADATESETPVETTPLDIGMVSGMDEIQIEMGTDIPPREFNEMENEFRDDDESGDGDENAGENVAISLDQLGEDEADEPEEEEN